MNKKEINACNEVNEEIIETISNQIFYIDHSKCEIFLRGIKSQAEKELEFLKNSVEYWQPDHNHEYIMLNKRISNLKIAIEVIGRYL